MRTKKKLTSGLPMVGGSLRVLGSSSTTKTDHHDIAEILLKVALNTLYGGKNTEVFAYKCPFTVKMTHRIY
jgi:hypothetical protein